MGRRATTGPTAQKVGLYQAIHTAAARQRVALQQDDFETFSQLLIEREQLLDLIDRTGPSGDAPSAGDKEGPQRQKAVSLIQDILALDRESERLLSQKIGDVRDELLHLREARGLYGLVIYSLAPPAIPSA